jgi:hypothetical protein
MRPDVDRRAIAVGIGILVVALFAQGLALLNDAVFWDGWIEWVMGKSENFFALRRIFKDSGLPHFGLFHEAVMRTEHPIAWYRILGLGGFLIYVLGLTYVAWRYCGFAGTEAAVFGCVAVCHRTATTSLALVTVPYFLCGALFSLATVATFASMAATRDKQTWLRAIAAVLFFASFSTQSFLLLVYVVLLIVAALQGGPVLAGIARAVARRPELLVLPPIFFFVKPRIWKTGGPIYGQYNSFNVDADTPTRIFDFFEHGVVRAVTDGLGVAGASLLTALPISLLLCLRVKRAPTRNGARFLWGMTLLLLLVSVVPYVMVGKVPTEMGWSWRHALLVPPALGCAAVALLRSALASRALVCAAALVVLVALGEMRASQDALAAWLGRAARDRGLILQLREARPPSVPAFVWFEESQPLVLSEPIRFYEWNGFFFEAWGQTGSTAWRVGYDVGTRRLKQQAYWGNPGFDLYGPHMLLSIETEAPFDATQTGLAYLFAHDRDDFARSLLRIRLSRIDPPESFLATVEEMRGDPLRVPRLVP